MASLRLQLLVVLLCFLPLTSPSPTSGTPSAARKQSRRAVTRPPPPDIEDAADDEKEDEGAAAAEEEDVEVIAASPPPPPRKTAKSVSKKSKRAASKKRRAPPPPPPPSMLGSFSAGWTKLSDGAREQYRGLKASFAEHEEARRIEAAKARRAQAARMRQLREEMETLQAQAEAEGDEVDPGEVDGEGLPLTLSERGAILGSVLLSPAGVPGVVVGGAFGGAAGYVTERIEQARAYISGAYHERVETEKQNAAQMASTHEELKSLDEVRVRADDPEEAAELTRAMLEFLAEPANCKCADCAAALKAHNDGWASLNLGVLVCVNCAAVHRSMGTNVSRIKSVVFDRWDGAMVRTMLEGGNERARSAYLARLPRGYAEPPPDADAERRAAFIRAKYVRLKWAQPALREARRAQIAQIRHRKASAVAAGAKSARAGPMPSLSSEHA